MIERLACGRGEYEISLVPFRPSCAALFTLLCPLGAERICHSDGQHKGSTASPSLGLGQHLTPPRNALKRFVHPQLPSIKIEVRPLEPQSLSKSQASTDGQDDQPVHCITAGRFEQARRLLWRKNSDVFVRNSGRIDQACDVPCDYTPTHRPVERDP